MIEQRKALIVTLSIVCCSVLIEMFFLTFFVFVGEGALLKNRKSMAGKIDTIILGASHAQTSFSPIVLDEQLDTHTYNVSVASMTWDGRKAVIEDELRRNRLDKVILEISYNSMTRDAHDKAAKEGDLFTSFELEGFRKKIVYYFQHCFSPDVDAQLSELSRWGAFELKKITISLLSGCGIENAIISAHDSGGGNSLEERGFVSYTQSDLSLKESEYKDYQSDRIQTNWNGENVAVCDQIIEMCQESGAEVIIVVTPIALSTIWKRAGWDDFYYDLSSYAKLKNCTVYDFNLLKNREQLYNDVNSFHDGNHMCRDGALRFSEAYSKIVSSNEPIDDLFYDSYETLISECSYTNRLQVIR